jgi:parvulin-like peptidyl-prolyl isomerase
LSKKECSLPKKKVNQPQREMTRRQLSHWQRENRRQRIILLSGIILIVAILAVVGTGLFMNQYKPYHVTVVKVEDTEYSMDYYINMLTYTGIQYGSPNSIPYFADSVPDSIAQNQIDVEQAAKLGITVSDSEVQQYLKDNKLSSEQTRIDAVRAILTVQKMKTDYFPKLVPESAEHRNMQAMFLESQSQANAIEARLDKGENFTDLAAELSLEKTSKENKGDFGWVPNPQDVLEKMKNMNEDFGWTPIGVLSNILNKGNGNTTVGDNSLENYVFAANTSVEGLSSVEDKVQSKDLGYWLVKVSETRTVTTTPTPTSTPSGALTPITTTEAHVYTMLLSNRQQADDIKAKLDQGGEANDWASLAKANSLDDKASSGGDRGFISKGKIEDELNKVIFPDDASQVLEANKVSGPLADTTQSTPGGFWLVKMNGTSNQTIVDSNRTFLAQNMLTGWLQKVWTDNQSKVQILLTDQQKTFAVEQAQKR